MVIYLLTVIQSLKHQPLESALVVQAIFLCGLQISFHQTESWIIAAFDIIVSSLPEILLEFHLI